MHRIITAPQLHFQQAQNMPITPPNSASSLMRRLGTRGAAESGKVEKIFHIVNPNIFALNQNNPVTYSGATCQLFLPCGNVVHKSPARVIIMALRHSIVTVEQPCGNKAPVKGNIMVPPPVIDFKNLT
jgi:hypothetical protein